MIRRRLFAAVCLVVFTGAASAFLRAIFSHPADPVAVAGSNVPEQPPPNDSPPPPGTDIDAHTGEAWQAAGFRWSEGGPTMRILPELKATRPLADGDLKNLPVVRVLFVLDLSDTKVTNEGMKILASQKYLAVLRLRQTSVTGAGLRNLAGLKHLTSLSPDLVTDEVLESLARVGLLHALDNAHAKERGARPTRTEEVVRFDLYGTKVTAAGLKHLAQFPNLASLNLFGGPPLTDELVEALAELRLLHCLPSRDSNVGSHPDGPDSVHGLDLSRTKLTDASLKHIAALTNLAWLDLSHSPVTDAGLAHLGALKKLTRLDLNHTKVTDDGLKHLAGLTELAGLHLIQTKVTDAGFKHLIGLRKLNELSVSRDRVTSAALATLAEADLLHALAFAQVREPWAGRTVRPLAAGEVFSLNLSGTRVTDAGLKHLARLKNLARLDLSDTLTTLFGAAEIQQALPNCKITR